MDGLLVVASVALIITASKRGRRPRLTTDAVVTPAAATSRRAVETHCLAEALEAEDANLRLLQLTDWPGDG